MELRVELLDRGRFAGRYPSPAEYSHLLWNGGALLQTAVCDASTDELVGIITTYEADLRNQTAYLAVASAEHPRRRGLVLAGLGAQVHVLFTDWPFRKLYAEVLESNRAQFARGLRELFELEGTLVGDHRTRSGYEDRHLFALYRRRWFERMGPVVQRRIGQDHDPQLMGRTVIVERRETDRA